MKVVSRLLRVLEIALSVLVLAVVFINGTVFLIDYHVWLTSSDGFQNFLDQALLYVIALEFAMMIIKRDPRLVIEVLIFAIARKMVITMDTGSDFLMGTIAIFLLFWTRFYFFKRTEVTKTEYNAEHGWAQK